MIFYLILKFSCPVKYRSNESQVTGELEKSKLEPLGSQAQNSQYENIQNR